jgi:hypothetical protein
VLDRAGCSADTPPRRSGQSWLMASAANFGHRCTRLQTSTAVDRPDNAEDSLPVTAEGHRRDRDLGHPRERPPAAGPDSRALSLIARGVVGSIESTCLLLKNTVLRLCARPDLPPDSAFDRDSRGRCAGDASNMMAECWVLTASHAGPVSARLLASHGVRSDRRDRDRLRAFPRPVQRGHDDPPGQPWWNTWPGSPLPRLTDVPPIGVIISCPHGRRSRLQPKARPSATVP